MLPGKLWQFLPLASNLGFRTSRLEFDPDQKPRNRLWERVCLLFQSKKGSFEWPQEGFQPQNQKLQQSCIAPQYSTVWVVFHAARHGNEATCQFLTELPYSCKITMKFVYIAGPLNLKAIFELFFFQPITADTFRAEIEVVEHCDCTYLTLWLALILTFKVLILLTGAFLAWQTRRVYIPSLNDTQHCVSCMFVVVLFCLVGSIVAFTTTMYPDVFYGVIGIFIIVATTLILLLLFVNKVSKNLNIPCISS